MNARKSVVEHYLITIDLCPLPGRIHGYVMTDDNRTLLGVADHMMSVAEKQGFKIMLPIILQTKLTTGSGIVRKILRKLSPKTDQALRTAKDFHYSIFMTHDGHPDDKRLMDLH